jgi:hypothetical protein
VLVSIDSQLFAPVLTATISDMNRFANFSTFHDPLPYQSAHCIHVMLPGEPRAGRDGFYFYNIGSLRFDRPCYRPGFASMQRQPLGGYFSSILLSLC